jgi:hypothetical protein
MHYCQRLLGDTENFLVIRFPDKHNLPTCGRPAQFRAKFENEGGDIVEMWLCADCADLFERRFHGAWGTLGNMSELSEEAD